MKREVISDEIHAPELELRVFYGPQAGSRLVLAAGHYLIGSSDECTIILNGPRIEDEHALIDFDDALPSITPLNGKVSDAQGNSIDGRLPLSFGMPLEIGGVWIAVDYIDSPWPDPTSVAPISSASPVAVPELLNTTISSSVPVSSIKLVLPTYFKSNARLIVGLSAMFFLLMVISGAGFFAWSLQNKSDDQELVATTESLRLEPLYLQRLRKQLNDLTGKDHLNVMFTADGVVTVTGYVEDLRVKKNVENILKDYSPVPTSIIYAQDQIFQLSKKLIDDNINSNRAMLNTESFNAGTLKINGTVSSASIRDEIFDLIKNGVPGISKIDGSIMLADDLPKKLEDEITSSGLARRFQVVTRQPEFFLRGKLTENEFNIWEKLLVRFTDSYGSLLPIRANIATLQTTLPVNIETIVGGSTPFVITKKGERIERGGDINGNVLTVVKDNEIIFDGNERFRIGR